MTGVLITARFQASRLPGKVMMEVCGRPLLSLLIERLKASTGWDKIILCTSESAADDPLAELARREGVECFRGHLEDVLLRYRGAARHYSLQHLVIADGDDLFCEPSLVKVVADKLREGFDYVSFQDMPYGSFPYGISVKALEKVCEMKDESETEGWGRYFLIPDLFRTLQIPAPPEFHHPEYRMTLDYPEDFAFIREVYGRLYRPGRPFPLGEAMDLLERNPEIPVINASRQEEYLSRFRAKYSHVKLKKERP